MGKVYSGAMSQWYHVGYDVFFVCVSVLRSSFLLRRSVHFYPLEECPPWFCGLCYNDYKDSALWKNVYIWEDCRRVCLFLRGVDIFNTSKCALTSCEECRHRPYGPWCVTTIIKFLNYRLGVLGSYGIIITYGLRHLCVLSFYSLEELEYFHTLE